MDVFILSEGSRIGLRIAVLARGDAEGWYNNSKANTTGLGQYTTGLGQYTTGRYN